MTIDIVFGKKIADCHYKLLGLKRKNDVASYSDEEKMTDMKEALTTYFIDSNGVVSDLLDDISRKMDIAISEKNVSEFMEAIYALSYAGYILFAIERKDLTTINADATENYTVRAYAIDGEYKTGFSLAETDESVGNEPDVLVVFFRKYFVMTNWGLETTKAGADLETYDLLQAGSEGYKYSGADKIKDYINRKGYRVLIFHA